MPFTAVPHVFQQHGVHLPHVWAFTAACVDYSGRWTMEQAAAKGWEHLLEHLARTSDALALAPAHEPTLLMDFAAQFGHLAMLQRLHTTPRLSHCSTRAMDDAAKNGHFAVVQWLHQQRSEGCTTRAMDYAAMNGHFELVQWLHQVRTEGCTTRAMELAARNGHLHVMQWLHAHQGVRCTALALNYAAAEGHVDAVQWLLQMQEPVSVVEPTVRAARGGHLAVLQLLIQRSKCVADNVGARGVQAALRAGRVAVAQWLLDELAGDDDCDCDSNCGLDVGSNADAWMDAAVDSCDVHVVAWLQQALGQRAGLSARCSVATIQRAAARGSVQMLQHVHDHAIKRLETESEVASVLCAAAAAGEAAMVQWLLAQHARVCAQVAGNSTSVMDAAAAHGHLDVLVLLHQHWSLGSHWKASQSAIDGAARRGNVDVLCWLYEHAAVPATAWTPLAMEHAAGNGHLGTVEWLISEHREACAAGEDAVTAAVYMDHVRVLQRLLAEFPHACTIDQAIEHAEDAHATHSLTWLREQGRVPMSA
ncbi:TPA: hypothetical protein N0F65_011897 [Lagenidium giganteum]|uniref:Ankyrin repeat protein n=1 Tax=Lagenidium giganteum TaxID=4803 RepID=A0AAV2YGT7_9STRA|nr:TPA: hypothetical protein N0F65_011897 [Lagenidium giganteum]